MKSSTFSFVSCGQLNVHLYYCRTQVYEVDILLSKPFIVAIIHLFFFLLFSSQPSARAVCCIQMIVRSFSEGINNDRVGFISKGHAESVSRSDFFHLKLVSLQFTLKWLTSDLLELK